MKEHGDHQELRTMKARGHVGESGTDQVRSDMSISWQNLVVDTPA